MAGRIEGASAGCPFCRFAGAPILQVGVRFRKLSGFDPGRTGTVIKSPALPPFSQDEFLAQMDGDPAESEWRILPRDIIEPLPASEPPDWALPLSIADTSEIHPLIVNLCDRGNSPDGWSISWDAFYDVIGGIWRRRLPITGKELWRVLHAHGVDEKFETALTDFFTRGRALLVYANGRRPIKKKRTKPFSVGSFSNQ